MNTPDFATASRLQHITPFLVMEILERAQAMERAGRNIIHLEIGEPDFATPSCIVDAGKAALDAGHTHYTTSAGDTQLREAVARMYGQRYKVQVSPEQVLIFPGTSPGMMLLFGTLCNPGDEVILSNPGYPCYANFVRFTGGVVREVCTYEEEGFQYRPEEVRRAITPRTRAILVNSPCNPTGIVLEAERMRALGELANHGPYIISDEIYHGLTYHGPEHSMLEFTEHAIVIGGFSKAFAMTGWRLGYLIVPKPLVRPLLTLLQNFFIATNAVVQQAGLCALAEAEADVVAMREEYDIRRRYVLGALRDMGFSIPVEPCGAFYVLFNARHLAQRWGNSSVQLAFDILDKANVALAPGVDFGSQTEGFLRLSYANSMENLQEAMRRLQAYVRA